MAPTGFAIDISLSFMFVQIKGAADPDASTDAGSDAD